MSIDEGAGSRPEGGEGARIVEDVDIETVLQSIVPHEAKDIVIYVAEVVDLQYSLAASLSQVHS